MAKGVYHHIREAWKKPKEGYLKQLNWERLIQWRREDNFIRVARPTRLDRARSLGYKAKQGVIIVRGRVRRGGLRRPRFVKGRRGKRMGMKKITAGKSIQRICEERGG